MFSQPECHCPTSHRHPLSLTNVDHAMSSNSCSVGTGLSVAVSSFTGKAMAELAASQALSSSIGFACC